MDGSLPKDSESLLQAGDILKMTFSVFQRPQKTDIDYFARRRSTGVVQKLQIQSMCQLTAPLNYWHDTDESKDAYDSLRDSVHEKKTRFHIRK